MKDFLSSYEIAYIVQAAYAILGEDKITQGDTQPAFVELDEPRKTSFTEFVNLIITNPDADLSQTGFGLSWLIPDENQLIIKTVLGMASTFKSIDKTPIKSGFEELQTALQADPGYAWSWHCNIAMPFMDSGKGAISHMQANTGAAWVMKHIFDIDTLSTPEFKGIEEQFKKLENEIFNVVQLDQSNPNTSLEAVVELVEEINLSRPTFIDQPDVVARAARGMSPGVQMADESPFSNPATGYIE